jgi:2',3'-cyclic-nucleotide 2'-phosphodiesterase (5'-nucleotidase family)
MVKEIDGRKIGIIGYVTTSTPQISNPGDNVLFLDEIDRQVIDEPGSGKNNTF